MASVTSAFSVVNPAENPLTENTEVTEDSIA